MSDIIQNNEIGIVEEDSNDGNAQVSDPSPRRQQHQPQQAQIHRIFPGQPPRGFRFAHRRVHPNSNISGINPTSENGNSNGHSNGQASRNHPANGEANGNLHINANRNIQRLRLNMGGRGPFIVRQHQRQNSLAPNLNQQQQQQNNNRRQFQYHPMGPNGPVQMGPNGPVQVRMVQVQVDPLAPQPLSTSTATTATEPKTTLSPRDSAKADQRAEDPPDYERYKCEICYEYLNDPVGCGKCASRFCRACLQRVYDSDKQKQQPTKCPVCRCEYDEMVPDHGMYNGNCPKLPCRFVCNGCPERNLPLFQIASHEQVCEHVPVRCRYAPYGCRWIGKRGLIGAHEEFGCKFAPMGKFIEQYRQTKADHTMRLEMIAQQASGAVRMSHVLRQTYTRDNQRKSLSDIPRLFQYCHAATSLTPHFLMTKDLWVSYWRNNESRAAVVNFCVCIPFLSAAFGVIGHGTASFFELFEEISPGRTLAMLARAFEGSDANVADISNRTANNTLTIMINKLQQAQTEELVITAFLGACVGTLGFLVIMLNYVDTKSNISWDKIPLPYFGGRFPLVGDAMTISIFTLLLAIMEYHQSNMRAVVLWMTIVVTSTFFPALVFSISHYTARLVTRTPRPTSFNLMEMARLVEPCMFGLRFSMAITYFGVAATLDASVALSLLPQTSRLHLKNSWFDNIPWTMSFGFLMAKCSYWTFQLQDLLLSGKLDFGPLTSAVTIESAQKFFTSSPDAVALSNVLDSMSTTLLATVSLVITSFIMKTFFDLGITAGDYIAVTSQEELSPEGIARGTAKEYSQVGLLAFGTWVMMIALLVRI